MEILRNFLMQEPLMYAGFVFWLGVMLARVFVEVVGCIVEAAFDSARFAYKSIFGKKEERDDR